MKTTTIKTPDELVTIEKWYNGGLPLFITIHRRARDKHVAYTAIISDLGDVPSANILDAKRGETWMDIHEPETLDELIWFATMARLRAAMGNRLRMSCFDRRIGLYTGGRGVSPTRREKHIASYVEVFVHTEDHTNGMPLPIFIFDIPGYDYGADAVLPDTEDVFFRSIPNEMVIEKFGSEEVI